MRKKAIALHWQILLGLVVGAALGIAANLLATGSVISAERLSWFSANVADPVGKVFLRLIFMVVIPLVFY